MLSQTRTVKGRGRKQAINSFCKSNLQHHSAPRRVSPLPRTTVGAPLGTKLNSSTNQFWCFPLLPGHDRLLPLQHSAVTGFVPSPGETRTRGAVGVLKYSFAKILICRLLNKSSLPLLTKKRRSSTAARFCSVRILRELRGRR